MELEKEINWLLDVLNGTEVLDSSAREVFELAVAYCKDALHFLKKGDRWNALEAYSIAWAYVDALLHLKKVKVPEDCLAKFTV